MVQVYEGLVVSMTRGMTALLIRPPMDKSPDHSYALLRRQATVALAFGKSLAVVSDDIDVLTIQHESHLRLVERRRYAQQTLWQHLESEGQEGMRLFALCKGCILRRTPRCPEICQNLKIIASKIDRRRRDFCVVFESAGQNLITPKTDQRSLVRVGVGTFLMASNDWF